MLNVNELLQKSAKSLKKQLAHHVIVLRTNWCVLWLQFQLLLLQDQLQTWNRSEISMTILYRKPFLCIEAVVNSSEIKTANVSHNCSLCTCRKVPPIQIPFLLWQYIFYRFYIQQRSFFLQSSINEVNKMLSYRRETALQGALYFSPKVEDWKWKWETIFYWYYRSVFNHCDIIGQQSYRIRWKNAK